MKPGTGKHIRADQVAHRMVRAAVSRGDLLRADMLPCCNCGRTAAEWHHPDYSKPLAVIPLCLGCHRSTHRRRVAPFEDRCESRWRMVAHAEGEDFFELFEAREEASITPALWPSTAPAVSP